MADNYKKLLTLDKKESIEYFRKSLQKTEQQKLLESLLKKDNGFLNAQNIADIACGGGSLSYHLSKINKTASFTLLDYHKPALDIAREINTDNAFRFKYVYGNVYNLPLKSKQFDRVFCWQAFLCFYNPEQALSELIRITNDKGKIYMSSLFNFDHDVDIYTKIYDRNRESGKRNIFVRYNTFSEYTIKKWLQREKRVKTHNIIKCDMQIDIPKNGRRGLGTYTISSEIGKLQISGGLLMSWGILIIELK
jgi:ubiquinone/menaquinone biosynthesis C-methylase UbiE